MSRDGPRKSVECLFDHCGSSPMMLAIANAWPASADTRSTAAIGGAWDSLAGDAKAAWGSITTKASAWWDDTSKAAGTIAGQVATLASGMNDWFKSKTGIDIKSTVSSAATAVGNAAGGRGRARQARRLPPVAPHDGHADA
ncbi:hypothetical protein J7E49_14060 [Variovorax paradoxus]|nr:hypothetical protein [Variovorax paradoxus]